MSRGFPRIGAKPSPANPGNYARDFARRIKNKARPKKNESSEPRIELLLSTEPVPVELTKPNTSISGFGVLGIIFLISLALFVALTWFG